MLIVASQDFKKPNKSDSQLVSCLSAGGFVVCKVTMRSEFNFRVQMECFINHVSEFQLLLCDKCYFSTVGKR